jgi:hypothetical protein
MTCHAFKGFWAWEVQIGKLVFQVPHARSSGLSWLGRNFGLHVWVDSFGRWVK